MSNYNAVYNYSTVVKNCQDIFQKNLYFFNKQGIILKTESIKLRKANNKNSTKIFFNFFRKRYCKKKKNVVSYITV